MVLKMRETLGLQSGSVLQSSDSRAEITPEANQREHSTLFLDMSGAEYALAAYNFDPLWRLSLAAHEKCGDSLFYMCLIDIYDKYSNKHSLVLLFTSVCVTPQTTRNERLPRISAVFCMPLCVNKMFHCVYKNPIL